LIDDQTRAFFIVWRRLCVGEIFARSGSSSSDEEAGDVGSIWTHTHTDTTERCARLAEIYPTVSHTIRQSRQTNNQTPNHAGRAAEGVGEGAGEEGAVCFLGASSLEDAMQQQGREEEEAHQQQPTHNPTPIDRSIDARIDDE
jgi:hypothetical protein